MSRHSSINLSTAAKLCDKIAKLGVEPPAAIRKALAAIDEATTYVETRTIPDVLNLDPAELGKFILEASVTRHKGTPGNDGFQAGVDAVREAAAQQARAAALPELERVIEDLRPRFDELVAPLVSAVREYDFTLSTTSDEVINLEDEGASRAWRDARRAWDAISPYVALRTSINEVFDLRPNDADLPKVRVEATNLSVLFAAGDNWGLKGEFLTGRSIDWFAMARTGIRLNSPREVDAELEERRKAILRSKIVPQPERSQADVDAEVGAELASYGIR